MSRTASIPPGRLRAQRKAVADGRKEALEHLLSTVGVASVSLPVSTDTAYRIVKAGVSSSVLEPLGRYLDLGKGEVAEYLDMDRTTAQRKIERQEVLPTHASESVLRLLELNQLAHDTFETSESAARWLRTPHPMLDGDTPLDCAKSAFGGQRVKDILVALKYGGVV